MTVRSHKFHLNKRSAKLFGVCAGLADFLGVDALWVRVAFVVLTLVGSGFPLLAYLVIALVAEARPHSTVD